MLPLTRYNPIAEEEPHSQDNEFHLIPLVKRQKVLQTIILVLSAVNLLFLIALLRRPIETVPVKLKSPISEISTQVIAFNPDQRFSDPSNNITDRLWTDLTGEEEGFFAVENPRDYDLPQGVRWKDTPPQFEMYGISMFHQLHCLRQIRDFYWRTTSGGANDTRGPHSAHAANHITHCFDYLRQAIMCAGDTAIEYPITPELKTINGMGAFHVCRSFDVVKAYMDSHRRV